MTNRQGVMDGARRKARSHRSDGFQATFPARDSTALRMRYAARFAFDFAPRAVDLPEGCAFQADGKAEIRW